MTRRPEMKHALYALIEPRGLDDPWWRPVCLCGWTAWTLGPEEARQAHAVHARDEEGSE